MEEKEHEAEFDLVAPVYDSTRTPPSEQELETVVKALDGARRVLEVGVGTGRYSVPLAARGFEMTGLDISVEMMKLAHSKGLTRLIQGDLHFLPIKDKSFDASLIIHVLQLIPDPYPALRELARVTRGDVIALFPDRPSFASQDREKFRKRYREIAAEMGYEIRPRTRYWENTEKVLEEMPPDSVKVVEETVDADQLRERWRSGMRTFGGFITVPPEVHAKIMERLREERGTTEGRPHTRVRRIRVAAWNAPKLLTSLPTLRKG
jgi:ubiquinone/menaquinone biosynthesis C-methylase UbiE